MSTLPLSARAGLLKPSPTLAMAAKARKLKSEGKDVVSLAAGEPDFDTPEPICEAAATALRGGLTRYLPTPGLPALREAVADHLIRFNKIPAEPDEVAVSCGAKHSLYNAIMTLLGPGDEVLVPTPCWMTYVEQVRLAGAEPILVPATADQGFFPSLDDLKGAITRRTRAIILNSPCNPTGACLDREQRKAIAQLALRHDLWIISDEIYERLTYGADHGSIAALGKDVAERTVTVTGCSKTYAMTGWRIGFAHAPRQVAKAMCDLQDQVTSNATSFAQAGAVAALVMPDRLIEGMRDTFRARRDLILSLLRAIPGVSVEEPAGAFYVFPNFESRLSGRCKNDSDLAEALLEDALVATVPGSAFFGPGHLRLSYAASESDIRSGVARIAQFLDRLPA